jgi:hypothetical protein
MEKELHVDMAQGKENLVKHLEHRNATWMSKQLDRLSAVLMAGGLLAAADSMTMSLYGAGIKDRITLSPDQLAQKLQRPFNETATERSQAGGNFTVDIAIMSLGSYLKRKKDEMAGELHDAKNGDLVK